MVTAFRWPVGPRVVLPATVPEHSFIALHRPLWIIGLGLLAPGRSSNRHLKLVHDSRGLKFTWETSVSLPTQSLVTIET